MGQRYETGIFCQSKDVEHPWLNQAFDGVILHPFPTLGAQFHESPVGMVHHWLNLSSERWTMKCMMQPSPEIVSQFMKKSPVAGINGPWTFWQNLQRKPMAFAPFFLWGMGRFQLSIQQSNDQFPSPNSLRNPCLHGAVPAQQNLMQQLLPSALGRA